MNRGFFSAIGHDYQSVAVLPFKASRKSEIPACKHSAKEVACSQVYIQLDMKLLLSLANIQRFTTRFWIHEKSASYIQF